MRGTSSPCVSRAWVRFTTILRRRLPSVNGIIHHLDAGIALPDVHEALQGNLGQVRHFAFVKCLGGIVQSVGQRILRQLTHLLLGDLWIDRQRADRSKLQSFVVAHVAIFCNELAADIPEHVVDIAAHAVPKKGIAAAAVHDLRADCSWTSSYSKRRLRMAKLFSSTFFCALVMLLVIMEC